MIDRLEEEVDVLDRHLHVLKTVIANEPIGIGKMSNELGYPRHKVRYSLRRVEEAEVIEPTTKEQLPPIKLNCLLILLPTISIRLSINLTQ